MCAEKSETVLAELCPELIIPHKVAAYTGGVKRQKCGLATTIFTDKSARPGVPWHDVLLVRLYCSVTSISSGDVSRLGENANGPFLAQKMSA